MKNLKHLAFFKNENSSDTIILNRSIGSTVKLNSEVFEIISSAQSPDDIREIGAKYDDDDKSFFENIAVTTEKCRLFEDNSKDKKVKNISYILTDRCNLKCTHCSYSAKHISETEIKNICVNLDVLKKIISLAPDELSVTGGEPLLATNFSALMNMLNESFAGKVTLCTNATMIDEKNAADLCNCFDSFDISLDGYDEASSDAIRGKGVFKRVLKSINILKNNGAKNIKLSCAVKRDDDSARNAFTELCKSLEVEPIIRQMSLSGRAAENKLDDASDLSSFLTPTILSCNDCAGGTTMLTVDWDGNVFPCNNFTQKEYKIGNLLDDDILALIGRNDNAMWFKNFSQYLPDKRKECENCEVNLFCWNCPSVIKTFIESRGITSLSSICSKKKKKIMEELWGE